MKKFLTIAAVLILLLTLSVPAFAASADAPIDIAPSVSFETLVVIAEDGSVVKVMPADPAVVNGESLIDAANLSKNVENAHELEGYDVFDLVVVDENGNPVERTTPITVTLSYAAADRVIAAFVQNGDGTWTEVEFTVGEGTITLYLPHLTPVALVLGTPGQAAPAESGETAPAPEQGSTTPGGTVVPGGPVVSPQTGYNTALWAVLAVAMVACAGYCFVSARKKAAE